MTKKKKITSNDFTSLVDMTLPYYCLDISRKGRVSLDIGYLTDKNMGGFGKGLRGRFWDYADYGLEGFKSAINHQLNLSEIKKLPSGVESVRYLGKNKGDGGTFLFKLGEEKSDFSKEISDGLIDFLTEYDPKGIRDYGEKYYIIKLIEKARKSYCSDDPEGERKANVYVELDDLEEYLFNPSNLVYFRLQNLVGKPYKELKKLGTLESNDYKALITA